MSEQTSATTPSAPPRRKEMIGTVVSAKMQKTVVVAVEKLKRHRLYKKVMRVIKKYKAHDEYGVAKEGDLVRIVETRPLSKEKRWRVVEVIKRAAVPVTPTQRPAAGEGEGESEV